jgi:hypothetical protein
VRTRFLICVLLAVSIPGWCQTTQSVSDLLHAGLAAMGGEDKIRNLSGLHMQATVERNMLEQSERPEGPYIVESAERLESAGASLGSISLV